LEDETMLFNPDNNRRLGIANLRSANARSYASAVLHLPEGTPIYQGQLVHSQALTGGPGIAAAEWCGSEDSDAGDPLTMREISAHDSFFFPPEFEPEQWAKKFFIPQGDLWTTNLLR
jgi:hypothetical protein